ncbi:hypothetical protein WH47_01080 [Habropoda laboriosa]|uniref:Uncharacterized protein n=1 Tax=Habropoda laboriosa TaxID=597456 RepID=A0A0L7R121_9HYME|nr:hypothetical protein WH47_01080 [Habropoda laboriosa]
MEVEADEVEESQRAEGGGGGGEQGTRKTLQNFGSNVDPHMGIPPPRVTAVGYSDEHTHTRI